MDEGTLASCGNDGKIKLWPLRRRKSIACSYISLENQNLTLIPTPLTFSPDGTLMASVDSLFLIQVWDLQNQWQLIATFEKGHGNTVASACFSKNMDNETMILATGGLDNKVIVWDLGSKRKIKQFDDHQKPVYALSFYQQKNNPIAKFLLTTGDQGGIIKLN